MLSRDANLRELDENQKDGNRPFRIGLHAKVRLAQLSWCDNRMRSEPPPIAEAGGLAAGLLLRIPERPDSGVVDLEPAALSADADACVTRQGIQRLGFSQGMTAFASFTFRRGEP